MTRPLKLLRTMVTKVTNLNVKGIFILKTGTNEDKDKTRSRINPKYHNSYFHFIYSYGFRFNDKTGLSAGNTQSSV